MVGRLESNLKFLEFFRNFLSFFNNRKIKYHFGGFHRGNGWQSIRKYFHNFWLESDLEWRPLLDRKRRLSPSLLKSFRYFSAKILRRISRFEFNEKVRKFIQERNWKWKISQLFKTQQNSKANTKSFQLYFYFIFVQDKHLFVWNKLLQINVD